MVLSGVRRSAKGASLPSQHHPGPFSNGPNEHTPRARFAHPRPLRYAKGAWPSSPRPPLGSRFRGNDGWWGLGVILPQFLCSYDVCQS